MQTMRWTLAFGAALILGCALGPDTPEAVDDPAEAPPVVAEANDAAPADADAEGDATRRGKRGPMSIGSKASREAEAPAADDATDGPSADRATAEPAAPPSGITALGGSRWSVERRLVRKWEEQPRKFAKVAEKGKGWALKGVDSRDARHLGFQNGDVVISVNGHPLATQAQAVAAYGQVRKQDQLVVRFKRGGATRTHTVQIVD